MWKWTVWSQARITVFRSQEFSDCFGKVPAARNANQKEMTGWLSIPFWVICFSSSLKFNGSLEKCWQLLSFSTVKYKACGVEYINCCLSYFIPSYSLFSASSRTLSAFFSVFRFSLFLALSFHLLFSLVSVFAHGTYFKPPKLTFIIIFSLTASIVIPQPKLNKYYPDSALSKASEVVVCRL